MTAMIELSILEILSKTEKTEFVCSSDVAKQIAGENWEDRIDAVNSAAVRLNEAGYVRILNSPDHGAILPGGEPLKIFRSDFVPST